MSKLRLNLKSVDHKILDLGVETICKAVKATGGVISGPIPLPTDHTKYPCIHSRVIDVYYSSAKTIDALMRIDLSDIVKVKVTALSK
jgi:small subunit ribosomal protein S10